MIRLVGAVLVAFGSACLGLGAAADLGRRVRRLEAVSAGLELLERELWERGSPLPELLDQLAQRTSDPACTLFAQCAQACGRLEQAPFSESWRHLVDSLDGLPEGGRRALLPLGEVLGRYEAQGQREAIAQVRAALERERTRAEEEKLRMGRVYQALGLSGGAFLVILLL